VTTERLKHPAEREAVTTSGSWINDTSAALVVQPAAASRRSRYDLAIAIPTFNRATQLSALLAQLASHSKQMCDGVALVVSDNDSTDGTPSVIASFAAQHPEVAFFAYKQTRNIGAIPNIEFLVSSVPSEWVWCIGDDDLLYEGALTNVLTALSNMSGDVLLVRADGIGEWNAISGSGGILDVAPATKRGAAFLMAAGFLASAILRTSVWRALLARAASFDAPNYSNWVAVLLVASESTAIRVMDTPTVRGNANMVGPVRFSAYEVLTLERLRTHRRLMTESRLTRQIALALHPYIASLFSLGWRTVAAGSNTSLRTPTAKVAGFVTGFRLIGWRGLRALPWFSLALLLPAAQRRRLMSVYRRFRTHVETL
jgi:hypothetical protein